MTLQNRVTPFGEIIATAARGTMMGNRGGRFHRDDKTLGRRRWASHHWICCELHYKNQHHEPMGKGYTSLFFLDEVTALAAGHRPCFFCRRAEAKRFFALMKPRLTVDEADRLAHRQRNSKTSPSRRKPGPNRQRDGSTETPSSQAVGPGFRRDDELVPGLPDGAMVATGGEAFALRGGSALRWSSAGYAEALPRSAVMHARLLTPPLYVGILAEGYEPRWHESALHIRGGAA
jgi:hypothetical protein